MKVVWNDGFYLENLKQWKLQRWGCQAFKNILGLQVISSMLGISTIYFYTDKESVFQKTSSVVTSCWKPGMLESGHFLSVFTGHWAALWEVPESPVDPDYHMTREIGNIVVLPVEMLNDTDPFSFVMWMKCGAQWWFLQKMYILVPTRQWAPIQWWKTLHVSDLCLLRDQPWIRLNLTKFCLHGRFRPKSCPHWCCLDKTTCFPQWEHLDLTLHSAH